MDGVFLFFPFLIPILLLVILLAVSSRKMHAGRYKWSLRGALTGGILVAAYMLFAVFTSKSSTAAIGLIFIPVYAAIAAFIGYVVAYVISLALVKREEVTVEEETKPGNLSSWLIKGVVLLLIGGIGWVTYVGNISGKAIDPGTPEKELRELINHPVAGSSDFVLSMVAMNPSAPVDVLETLSTHPESTVRMGILNNKKAPCELMTRVINADEIFKKINFQEYNKRCK